MYDRRADAPKAKLAFHSIQWQNKKHCMEYTLAYYQGHSEQTFQQLCADKIIKNTYVAWLKAAQDRCREIDVKKEAK